MTNYNEIKGAKELVNQYKETYAVINNSIAELKNQKEKLVKGLDNSENQFTIESIEKNSKRKHKLNLINQYLKEAERKKAELDKEITSESYRKVRAVLSDNLKENEGKYNDINKQIIEHLYQSRYLYQELANRNREENERVQAFINDMAPYMVDLDTFRSRNGGRSHYDLLKDEALGGRSFLYQTVPQAAYHVKGLLAPVDTGHGIGESELYNTVFGVDVEEQKRKVQEALNKE